MRTTPNRRTAILTGLIFFHLFWSGVIRGQVNSIDTIILLQAIGQISSQTVSAYSDPNGKLIKAIKSGTCEDRITGSRLTLSREEQDYILKQLENPSGWPENLFSNSKRIDADSIWDFMQQSNARPLARDNEFSSQPDSLAMVTLRSKYHYVFKFARPIYIRDNTVCLLSVGGICGGDCGIVETSFYKKEGDGWKKWIRVSGGVF
jgi:hypothetical protein